MSFKTEDKIHFLHIRMKGQLSYETQFLLSCKRCSKGHKISILWKPLGTCACQRKNLELSNNITVIKFRITRLGMFLSTSTMKQAQLVFERFSKIPFKMVMSSLRITWAISKKSPWSLHTICKKMLSSSINTILACY